MSTQITTAFVQQYRSNVYHLLQQKGSKLRRACRVETQTGKSGFYDQIGATAAVKRTSRHADTPRMDIPHARRRVTLSDYEAADLVDNQDQIRMLIDPASPYAEAIAMALGRAIDDEIIAAADGTAFTGETGATSTVFDTTMIVDVQVVWPGVTAADSGLNVAKLLDAGRLLGGNNVDPDEKKYVVVNSRQIKSLLMDTRVSSHDYNAIKPLVAGQIVQFAGFEIIPTERIGTDSNTDDKCLYWAGNGMLLAIGQDIRGRISERPDKSYAVQVYGAMSVGATRMEEGRVGYIECDIDAGPEGNLD